MSLDVLRFGRIRFKDCGDYSNY